MINNSNNITQEIEIVACLYKKYLKICENIEIVKDPTRCHCPVASCQSVCNINMGNLNEDNYVQCEKCEHEFCSKCFKKWPRRIEIDIIDLNNNAIDHSWNDENSCRCAMNKFEKNQKKENTNNNKLLLLNESTSSLSNFKNIKRCPKCSIPIERAEGCAQIMCKFCKHTFCFFCLQSLEVSSFINIFNLENNSVKFLCFMF
jgi:hypothetical protein